MNIVYKVIFTQRIANNIKPYYYIGSKSNCIIKDGLILFAILCVKITLYTIFILVLCKYCLLYLVFAEQKIINLQYRDRLIDL
jgi:hypothetical protein